MTENRIWYVNSNRKTFGPYTKDEVIQMLKSGSLKFNDYLFKEGYGDWDFIYNVAEFDRRLIMPDGGQPLVEAPKAEVPIEESDAAPEGQDLWFVHDGEHQMGPYTSSYIKESLNNKTIFWTYYVWRDGFENWVQIKECKEFERRTRPRGQAPANVDITTNFEEIKKQAMPTIDQNKEMYGTVDQQSSYQYGLTEEDQEELKGKYPVKAIISLIVISILLFTAVRMYPKIMQNTRLKMRESNAESIYDKAQDLLKQNKLDEAYNKFYDLSDMYPDTKASRKSENELRSKEPAIKSQVADETRRIKNLMDAYTKKYGIMPSNAVDIAYVPPFYMKYFADTYFKRDANGKIAIMTKGTKVPVQEYVFLVDGNSKEIDREDLKPEEFALNVQMYIKLSYAGKRTVVKPLDIPQIVKQDLGTVEKKAYPAPKENKSKEPVKKPVNKIFPPKEENTEEQQLDSQDNVDNVDNGDLADESRSGITRKSKKVVAPEEQDITDEDVSPQDENAGEQLSDEINKIRTDK
jgi:hypothetical protein